MERLYLLTVDDEGLELLNEILFGGVPMRDAPDVPKGAAGASKMPLAEDETAEAGLATDQTLVRV